MFVPAVGIADVVVSAHFVHVTSGVFVIAGHIMRGNVGFCLPAGPVRPAPVAVNSPVSGRIVEVNRIPMNVGIKIGAFRKSYWIFAEEPSKALIIVAGPILVNPDLGIELSRRVLERIGERARGRSQLPKGGRMCTYWRVFP